MAVGGLLARLGVALGADPTSFKKGVGEARKEWRDFGKEVGDVGRSLSRNVTAPIVAVGAAAVASAVNLGNYSDRLLDLAEMTGLSTDALQSWRAVAIQAGVSTDVVADSVIKLQTRMSTGAEGSADLRTALSDLGIQMKDVEGNTRDMDAIVVEAITKLSGMEDVTTRNVTATRLFGRSASELAPILGLGADAIQEAIGRADRLGLVLGGDALNAANAFRIEWDFMKESLAAATRDIGAAVLPLVSELAGFLNDQLVPSVRGVIEHFAGLDDETKRTIAVVSGVVAAIGPLAIGLGAVAAAINPVSLGFIAVAAAISGAVVIVREIKQAFDAFNGTLRDTPRLLQNLIEIFESFTNPIIGFQRALARSQQEVIKLPPEVDWAAGEIDASLGVIGQSFEDVADDVETSGSSISREMERLQLDVNRRGRMLQQGQKDIFDAMVDESGRQWRTHTAVVHGQMVELHGLVLPEAEKITTNLAARFSEAAKNVEAETRGMSDAVAGPGGILQEFGGRTGQQVLDIKNDVERKWSALRGVLEAGGFDLSNWRNFASQLGELFGGLKSDAQAIVDTVTTGPGGVGQAAGGALDLAGGGLIGGIISGVASIIGSVFEVRAQRQGNQAIVDQLNMEFSNQNEGIFPRMDMQIRSLQDIQHSALRISVEASNQVRLLQQIAENTRSAPSQSSFPELTDQALGAIATRDARVIDGELVFG